MLADVELEQDFTVLTGQYRELIDSLLAVVAIPGTPVEVAPIAEGNFRGYDGNQFYVVQRGSIGAYYKGKAVFSLEEGDILLPDVAGSTDIESAVQYRSLAGARLHSYPALEFMRRVFSEPTAIRLWSRDAVGLGPARGLGDAVVLGLSGLRWSGPDPSAIMQTP